MVDIVQLIGKMDGWKDIPGRFEAIYFSRVQFMLDQFGSGPAEKAYLGMIANGECQTKTLGPWDMVPPIGTTGSPARQRNFSNDQKPEEETSRGVPNAMC